jgi:hypothetical protein
VGARGLARHFDDTAGAIPAIAVQGFPLLVGRMRDGRVPRPPRTRKGNFNEGGVREGLRRRGLPRDDVFVETKVWISEYCYDKSPQAFEKSARKPGVDQIDLLILHQPLRPPSTAPSRPTRRWSDSLRTDRSAPLASATSTPAAWTPS